MRLRIQSAPQLGSSEIKQKMISAPLVKEPIGW